MRKIVLIIFLMFLQLFAFKTDVSKVYAIGVFDEDGKGENIQHIRKTETNYSGTCFTKIFVLGNAFNIKPKVLIGDSIGHYESSKPIYKQKIKVGEVMIFKHYNVTSGLIKVYFRNKLYDSRVYVK